MIEGGTETIFLVEDDESVRSLIRSTLEDAGYSVIQASSGEDAMRVVSELDTSFQLLITDVVMPGMGGRAVSERMLARDPRLKVLFISGYTDDAVVRHGILHEQVNFLQKPFSPTALARKVRQILAE